jgi:hypothetical protein
MEKTIILHIPKEILDRADSIAARTNRSLEDVLLELLDRGVEAMPVDTLSDEEVLALSNLQMEPTLDDELAELQFLSAEGSLDDKQKQRLEELMLIYRRGMVRKAEALKVAVERKLIPPLN